MPESTAGMRESGVQMALAGQMIDNHPKAANNTRLLGPGSPLKIPADSL